MNRKSQIMKIFACVASLFILMSCMIVGASAAGKVMADTTTFTANEGDTITIEVKASDVAGTECGDLRFTYDAEYLEYVKDSVGAKDTFDADMCVGGEPKKGLVTCSFVFTNALEDSDMRVCTLEFKVIKAGTVDFKAEVGSWEGSEAPEIEIGNIVINSDTEATTEKKPDETTTEKKPDETTTEKKPVETTTEKEVVSEEDGSDIADVPANIPQTGDSARALMITAAVMGLASIAFVTVYYTKIKKDD